MAGGEDKAVQSFSAVKIIIASPAFQHVGTSAAVEVVVTSIAFKNVISQTSAEPVVTVTAAKMIIFFSTRKRIITRGTVIGYPGRRHSERDIFFPRGIIC